MKVVWEVEWGFFGYPGTRQTKMFVAEESARAFAGQLQKSMADLQMLTVTLDIIVTEYQVND